jgi:N4-(beta-N-acetylglucosaminyl)-L-asparaginase
MTNRRNFIKKATIGSLGMTVINSWSSALTTEQVTTAVSKLKKPLIISTWNHGFAANEEALRQLEKGKSAIDAIVSSSGFNYAVYDEANGNRMEDSSFKMSWDN